MAIAFVERPSPNHGPRAPGALVTMAVLHYTGMQSASAALDRLTKSGSDVSAHYLVDEDGKIYRLVDEARRAWHAGKASWRNVADVNSASIGIELVNPGHEFGYRAFPAAQIDALIALLSELRGRHLIDPADIVGHSDVAPDRKADPGELFPWRALAERGLALWPRGPIAAAPPDEDAAVRMLAHIGYGPNSHRDIVTAFQRRFRPGRCDGVLDPETMVLIVALASPNGSATA
jgi:N-acetylmuramoyl-L-alanine amidase